MLARHLYDLKLGQLEKLNQQDHKRYRADYPLLGETEFKDVLRQVVEAKRSEQMRVGWYSIPHDITVLVFVLFVAFTNLRMAIVAAVGSLVLFESIFQLYFNARLYPQLSWLVWLTYPAYILLGWELYSQGIAWYWIAVAIASAWGGIFLAGIVARIPMQLIMQARVEAAKRKASEPAAHK